MTGRNGSPRRRQAAAAAVSALALLGAACAADLPTAATIDEMDVTTAQSHAKQAGLLVPLSTDESPLFIVDGVITTSDVARSIEPGEIASIEVIKAQAGLTAYGERARDGVVKIATHSASGLSAPREADESLPRKTVVEMKVRGNVDSAGARGSRLKLESDNLAARPLIVVDGVIVDGAFSLNSLAPETIERIEVLKGEAARQQYDNPRAMNGVISITTKAGGR